MAPWLVFFKLIIVGLRSNCKYDLLLIINRCLEIAVYNTHKHGGGGGGRDGGPHEAVVVAAVVEVVAAVVVVVAVVVVLVVLVVSVVA